MGQHASPQLCGPESEDAEVAPHCRWSRRQWAKAKLPRALQVEPEYQQVLPLEPKRLDQRRWGLTKEVCPEAEGEGGVQLVSYVSPQFEELDDLGEQREQ